MWLNRSQLLHRAALRTVFKHIPPPWCHQLSERGDIYCLRLRFIECGAEVGARWMLVCRDGEAAGVECLRRLILSLIQVWTGPELRSVFLDPTCELPGLECTLEGVRRVCLSLCPSPCVGYVLIFNHLDQTKLTGACWGLNIVQGQF